MRKEKEEIILDFQEEEIGEVAPQEKSKRDRIMKNLRKTIKRNRDFRYLTCNVGKDKRMDQNDQKQKNNEVGNMCDKNEIESRLI